MADSHSSVNISVALGLTCSSMERAKVIFLGVDALFVYTLLSCCPGASAIHLLRSPLQSFF